MIYTKETFLQGIEHLKNLSAQEYCFYQNFFSFLALNPEALVVQWPPWGEDPEESSKPQDFKDFEKDQSEESFANFKSKVDMYAEAFKKFL